MANHSRLAFFVLTSALGSVYLSGAQNLPGVSQIHIKAVSDEIRVDGIINEETWQTAHWVTGFYKARPTDDEPATEDTEVSLAYNEKNLYLAAVCHTSNKGKYLVESLRRDFSYQSNDVFSFYIDPYNDKSNGFSFQTTPYNVQREGLVLLGGEVADDWDNKWYSAVTRHDDKYIVELAVPFKSFRYNSIKEWNINFLRNHPLINELTSWIKTPLQYSPSDLVYTGKLVWDQPPKSAKGNMAVIPYSTLQNTRDFEAGTPVVNQPNVGLDAKIGVTQSLNLDLTVNPDFSQVEVDEQVNNLSRFELSFPERRQFFLENQDLFAMNGFPESRPFFSRRIGIIGSGADARQIPIWFGSRLSGKIGRDWRIGALDLVTGSDKIKTEEGEIDHYSSQNYSLAILQRRVMKRSNISALIVNRDAMEFDATDTTNAFTRFNRVFGVDYNLASENNKWEGNTFYHRSVDSEKGGSDYAHGWFLGYRTRNIGVRYFHQMLGKHYKADVGFVPRTGVNTFGSEVEANFYPQNSKALIRHGPELSYNMVTNSDFDVLDKDFSLEYSWRFQNTSSLNIGYFRSKVTLLDSFEPAGIEGDSLKKGSDHQFGQSFLSFRTDSRKLLWLETLLAGGNFYTGTRFNSRLALNYRIQPVLKASFQMDYNRLNFDYPFKSVEYLLIGSRVDLTLSNSLFFTSFLQFNDRADNFNINTRFQWRFKPVSDVFLVYTENYGGVFDTNNFIPRMQKTARKNRAIVLKITYWLNI